MSKKELNKKTILQGGVTVIALALSAWMASGIFASEDNVDPVNNSIKSEINQKAEAEVSTKIIPHPEPVSLNTYVSNNKVIQDDFIEQATLSINNKLKTYRESQLDAMTAENLATVREAGSRGISLPQPVQTIIEPRQPEPIRETSVSSVDNYRDKPASPIESAVLSYFDPDSKSAYINVNGRTYKANEGSTISSLTITSISLEGVTVSSHGRTKLLTSNKGYSMPDKVIIEDKKKTTKSVAKDSE